MLNRNVNTNIFVFQKFSSVLLYISSVLLYNNNNPYRRGGDLISTNPTAVFAKALKYYISINGKTQQDLTKDLGISSSTLSQWVNGKMFPRMDKVQMLAQYFNISTADLMSDPYSKQQTSADPLMIAKLLEGNPSLYELFRLSLKLQDADIVLLQGVAQRLIELQGKEE
ncbi:MAG: helix-turn-helix transcriptional regulator [Roseburia sp.]|nr:helix-turn-helix transcriptional regulator [Roseburia sp.]